MDKGKNILSIQNPPLHSMSYNDLVSTQRFIRSSSVNLVVVVMTQYILWKLV